MDQVETDDFILVTDGSLVTDLVSLYVTDSMVFFCQSDTQLMVESEEDDADVECVGPEGLGATTSDGGWGGLGLPLPPPSLPSH